MIAVIFEVELKDAQAMDRYLELADALRPQLDAIDGFVSIDRFSSLANPNKLLSLSLWTDDVAVQQWRNMSEHREAQAEGKTDLFSSWSIYVASTLRHRGPAERE
jgi:heme-degrading monooxygenase HmoA